ncbi:hypothetical protein IWZ01DRAFT_53489 [Phyllosticta capitalensis]
MTVERTSSRFTQHLYSLLVTNFVFAFASLVRETAASNPFSFFFFSFLYFLLLLTRIQRKRKRRRRTRRARNDEMQCQPKEGSVVLLATTGEQERKIRTRASCGQLCCLGAARQASQQAAGTEWMDVQYSTVSMD